MRFADRREAGRALGEALKDFAGRDDVVVLRHPSRPMELVKRVAALPGERGLGPESYLVVGDKKTAAKSTKQKAAEKFVSQGAGIKVIS